MIEYVQGIVVNKERVLFTKIKNDRNDNENLLIRGPLRQGETEEDAILRIFEERLGVSGNIVFRFVKERYRNVATFLIDIDESKLEFDIDKASNSEDYYWVSLMDSYKFSSIDRSTLRNLLETCIEKSYSPVWLKALENLIFSDKSFPGINEDLKRKKRFKKHREFDLQVGISEKLYTIIASIAMGVIFNYFFREKSIGISYPIFTAVLTLFYLLSIKERSKENKKMGFLALGFSFILALNFSIHSNRVLNAINILLIPGLLTAAFMLMKYDGFKWYKIGFIAKIFKRIFALPFENMLKPFKFISITKTNKSKIKLSLTQKNILKGLGISLPLIFIIIVLLSSADMMFGYYITNFYKLFPKLNFGDAAADIVVIALVFIYIFGYIWSFKYTGECQTAEENKVKGKWEPVTILTIISVIDIIYLMFSIVQFSYLYGGGQNILPNGFTYAEYARRGFFELVLVTIINFSILLCCIKFMNRDNKKINLILNIFLTLLVFFTGNMLFSAHFKMSLYERTYGYTYLRVFVHVFILLLFVLFIISLAALWIEKVPMAKLSIIAALSMYVLLNYANVDAFIAKKNIERFNDTGKIDVYYLTCLSYDALPVIKKLENESRLGAEDKSILNRYFNKTNNTLSKKGSWVEFNYSKYRALKILK